MYFEIEILDTILKLHFFKLKLFYTQVVNKLMSYKFIFFIVLISILTISIVYNNFRKKIVDNPNEADIIYDGFIKRDNILSYDDIVTVNKLWDSSDFNELKKIIHGNSNLNTMISEVLGNDYILMDYIWYIEKGNVHTCHRDNNGDMFNKGTRRSYTMLLYVDYLNNCLEVVPQSNNSSSNIFISPMTQTIKCTNGSAILFDANLIHAGSLESNKQNRRIQLKVTHKYDIKKLDYYNNYNKYLNKENNNSLTSKYLQKYMTCSLPILSDVNQELNKSSGNTKNEPSILQKLYSYFFYSDANYYRLPDFSVN
jgi:hypothetical protein